MNWWVLRTLIVLEFVLVGLLFVCLLSGCPERTVINLLCLAFLVIMACVGLIVALLLEILEKLIGLITGQKKKRGR